MILPTSLARTNTLMKPTNIIDRFGVSSSRRNLADRILAKFSIPDTGVIIVFERDDYTNDLITIWGRDRMALHLNIKDGIVEMSPDHLLILMKSKDYDQLIWLSRQTCESEDIEFTWILSHELRHLEQELHSNALSKATYFLSMTLGMVNLKEPKVQNTIPAELDANLKAWRVTREILEEKLVDDYIENRSISGTHKEDFKMLKTYNPEAHYEVIERTLDIMKKYEMQLKDLQRRSGNQIIRNFDFESTLRKLENGPKKF